jgi:hypothetical protein
MIKYGKFFLIFTFFILITPSLYASFFVVNDKDGFVNVREKPITSSKVMKSIKNGSIVQCDDGEDASINGFCVIIKTNTREYIHLSRLKKIDQFKRLSKKNESENVVIFNLKNITVKIQNKAFDVSQNILGYKNIDGNSQNSVSLINGKYPWGVDSSLPSSQYNSITFKLSGKERNLKKDLFDDLYNPNNYGTNAYYDVISKRLFIVAKNSDGAGSYEVLFLINKDLSVNRLVGF